MFTLLAIIGLFLWFFFAPIYAPYTLIPFLVILPFLLLFLFKARKWDKAQEEKDMRWAKRDALEKEKARKESLISYSHDMTNKEKRRKR